MIELFVLFHSLVHLALCVILLQVFSLVVRFATARQTYSHLRQTSLVEEQAQAHNRQTLVLKCTREFVQLLAVEQELAVTLWDVVVAGTPIIFGDVHTSNPQFVLLEVAVTVDQRGLAEADRFNLGTHQNNTGDILLEYLVVECSTLVADIYLFYFCHIYTISHKDSKLNGNRKMKSRKLN